MKLQKGRMMDIFKTAGWVLAVVAVTGCASRQLSPQEERVLMTDVICVGKDQCAEYWQRAQVYLVKNSRLKIQMANDTVIQTNPSPNDSVIPAFSIFKTSAGGESFKIEVQIDCPNIYGMCYPLPKRDLMIQAKQFILGQ